MLLKFVSTQNSGKLLNMPKFTVASHAHEQTFICGNFYLPRKNRGAIFSANAVVTQNSGKLLNMPKFTVASHAHEQTFICGNFYLPRKNRGAIFSANAVVTQNSDKFSKVHEQIKLVTETLSRKICLFGCVLIPQEVATSHGLKWGNKPKKPKDVYFLTQLHERKGRETVKNGMPI